MADHLYVGLFCKQHWTKLQSYLENFADKIGGYLATMLCMAFKCGNLKNGGYP